MKFLKEGAKPYYGLYFLVIFAQIAKLWTLQLLFLAVLTYFVVNFQFYEIIILRKGLYHVGYKYTNIQGQDLGIFYPTKQEGQAALWIQNQLSFRHFYDSTYMDPLKIRWIPWPIFSFFISYLKKIKMPAMNAAKIELVAQQMNVIIFSGLSSNVCSHSSYCSWLASHGYIVISLQHNNDLVRLVYDEHLLQRKDFLLEIIYSLRNKQLQIRSQQMENAYRWLIDGSLFTRLFEQNVINVGRVTFIGHSFGAATILQTMANIQSKGIPSHKIDHLIPIDPWLFPLSDSTFSISLGRQITMINSETFLNTLPLQFKGNQFLSKLKRSNQSNLQVLVIMGTDHLFCADVVFVCGNGVTLVSNCGQYENSPIFFEHLQRVTKYALLGKINQLVKEIQRNQSKKGKPLGIKQQWRFYDQVQI